MSDDSGAERKAQEWLILLVLGLFPDTKMSMLHLEKEVFILWNFHPMIKDLISFVAHYRGPYSSEIRDIIIEPMYLTDSWEYIPPKSGDSLSGGFVILTSEGHKKYIKYYQALLEDEDLHSLLAGIKIVRTVYDDLSDEELLLLVYDAYPDFRAKSEVADDIYKKRFELTSKLLKRGIISEEKAEYLKNAVWHP